MKTIYKPDDGRRTIAEAKRLILDALPATQQVNIYMATGMDGDIRWDGPIGTEAVNEPMATSFMTKAIIGAMNEGLIKPRVTFNPAFTDYKGSESDDEHFGISHKEFEALAEQFDCRVVVGEPPAIEQTSVIRQPEESIDYAMLARPDQLIEAFGRFTGMNIAWFEKWSDYSALRDAIKVKGTSGRGRTTEPLFCPFLVMQGLMKTPRKGNTRKAFLTDEKPWELLKRYFPKVYSTHKGLGPFDD